MNKRFFQLGQTLVEMIIMMGIFALFLPALTTGLTVLRSSKPQQEQRLSATTLLRETNEAIRNVREAGWVAFAVNGTYYLVISGSSWQLVACQGSCPTTNGFTRKVDIADVNRDANGNIVATGGSLDPSSKKVTTTISWTQPYNGSIQAINYFTRYLDNLTYTQTTKAEFDAGTLNSVKTTNTSGGEVTLADNNKAKWCSPALSSATIDLPDGPPVAVSATASATTTTPNDVFVATSPYSTNSAKLAYLTVTANTDPPVPTLQGTFTLDASKYSNPSYIPTGINLTNTFKTNDVRYYRSASGKVYALLATDLPDHEVIAIQTYDGTPTGAFQDPVNKIYKYWTYFNTRIFNPNAGLDTGFANPSANSQDSGGDGNGFQTNPTRAYSDNASFAVDTDSGNGIGINCTGADKDKHRFYNYGFSLPSGATINGVEVRLDAKADLTTGSPFICVQLSWDGGTTWTAAKSTAQLTTNEVTYILGGPADNWGRTWNDTNFSNTNFRVRVINVASNISRDFSLDWVPVKVYYSTGASTGNDQAPFGYGATTITLSGTRGYVASGGYLYVIDLANIDSKSPANELDQVGCRIQLDGYDCQAGSPASDKKYSAGQTGTSWGDTGSPAHNDCSDGGNIELYATNDLSTPQVGASNYVFVAVGAGTNPEFEIVDATSVPSGSSSPAINNSSCGRISGGNANWHVVGTLDFNSTANTEEAANSVFAKLDGSRAYVSSNGGIDGNGDGQPDSKQFYILNTTNKSSISTTASYSGDTTNIQMFPRRSLTVLNGQRAVLVGKDGFPLDATDPKEYQVLNIDNETAPTYCGGLDYNPGFNDLTSVTEADLDNYVYMVANTEDKELKIIQGGPDGNYVDQGYLESSIFDNNFNTTFNRYTVNHTTPAQTNVQYQFAIADAVNGSCTGANYVFTGPDGTASTYYTTTNAALALSDDNAGYENPGRCLKYRTYLSTTDFNTTPVFQDITVNYSP